MKRLAAMVACRYPFRLLPLKAILPAAAVILITAASALSVNAEPSYVGARSCRTCHSSSDKDRYHNWLQSKHANAFEVLSGAEKTDPKCLACHTTGYAKPMSDRTTDKDLRGVQCEACHGPGSDYKKNTVMKDPKLARENGLWDVTRDVCLKCHK